MNKNTWTKDDRRQYEGVLSQIVTEETDKIPGLKDYRTINTTGLPLALYNIHKLNDLSQDIDNNSTAFRFDCGVQSVIKGLIIQKIEDEILPHADTAGYKQASSYFFSAGTISNGKDDLNGHIFIFTPGGNIIEATADPSRRTVAYSLNTNPNTLEQFIRGAPVVINHQKTYQGFHFSPNGDDKDAALSSPTLTSPERDQDPLQADNITALASSHGFLVLDARDKGFMFVVFRDDDCTNYLGVYQEKNKGTPEHGYMLVASDVLPDEDFGKSSTSVLYTDQSTHDSYMFTNRIDFTQSLLMLKQDRQGEFRLIQQKDDKPQDDAPLQTASQPQPPKLAP